METKVNCKTCGREFIRVNPDGTFTLGSSSEADIIVADHGNGRLKALGVYSAQCNKLVCLFRRWMVKVLKGAK